MLKIYIKKINSKHQDSFWYYNKHIATMGGFDLVASGDIGIGFPKASYDPDGDEEEYDFYKNGRAVEYAKRNKYTDKDLKKCSWLRNNWFIVMPNDDFNEEKEEIAHTYDEAIKLLKKAYKDSIPNSVKFIKSL